MRKMILTSNISPETVVQYVKKRKINIAKVPWRNLILDALLENDKPRHYIIPPDSNDGMVA